ncbi:MAG: STAS domain-containing protein [Armatimonadota bacterium]|nr:STAS domain-containing protein [Armatimonadota bacterium]
MEIQPVVERGTDGPEVGPLHDLLRVRVRSIGQNVAAIDVQGEIDIAVVSILETAMRDAIDQGYLDIILNMDGVEYLDSWGLRVLESSHRWMRDNAGTLSLAAPPKMVKRLLAITRLDKVLNVFPNEQEALAAHMINQGVWRRAMEQFGEDTPDQRELAGDGS